MRISVHPPRAGRPVGKEIDMLHFIHFEGMFHCLFVMTDHQLHVLLLRHACFTFRSVWEVLKKVVSMEHVVQAVSVLCLVLGCSGWVHFHAG